MERVWCYANDQLIPTNVASLVNYVGVLHLMSLKMSTVLYYFCCGNKADRKVKILMAILFW